MMRKISGAMHWLYTEKLINLLKWGESAVGRLVAVVLAFGPTEIDSSHHLNQGQ